MRNLVLLIVMLLSGGAGWYAGGWSGRSAREDLAKAVEAGKAATAAHEQAAGALKTQLAALTADYERDKQAMETRHTQVRSEAAALVAGSKTELARLTQERGTKQTELQRLRQELNTATTAQQKQQIIEKIVIKEVEVQKQEVKIAGEACVDTPVPERLLAKWQAMQAPQ